MRFTRQAVVVSMREKKKVSASTMIAPIILVAANEIAKRMIVLNIRAIPVQVRFVLWHAQDIYFTSYCNLWKK